MVKNSNAYLTIDTAIMCPSWFFQLNANPFSRSKSGIANIPDGAFPFTHYHHDITKSEGLLRIHSVVAYVL